MLNNIEKKLMSAVYQDNLEKVKALLSAGAKANLKEEHWDRGTLLHLTNSVQITKELLSAGAYINSTNKYSETPLHTAITAGKKVELVLELLKHGAHVNAINRKGNTALYHAVTKSSTNLEVVKELLKYGADINIRNGFRWGCSTSLDKAVHDLECAKLLIKYTLIRNFNKDYRKNINLTPYRGESNYSQLSDYLDDCVEEVLQMKTDEIIDGLPLYEFVTNINALFNNQLSIRLAQIDIDYSLRYPIYNDIILSKIKPFLERADLLNKLSTMQFYTKLDTVDQGVKGEKIILDYDSTYNITEYLSNDNLLNFIMAFDDSNEFTIHSCDSDVNNLAKPGTSLCEASTRNNCKRARLK